MRGLNIIVLTADAERFRGALTLAAAQAALGARAAIFLQLDAVTLLRRPHEGPRDGAHAAKGLPRLAQLIEDALELGVALTACQSGMELAGLAASDLHPSIGIGGPVGFLRAVADDERLLTV